jgi:hypothetical protein
MYNGLIVGIHQLFSPKCCEQITAGAKIYLLNISIILT